MNEEFPITYITDRQQLCKNRLWRKGKCEEPDKHIPLWEPNDHDSISYVSYSWLKYKWLGTKEQFIEEVANQLFDVSQDPDAGRYTSIKEAVSLWVSAMKTGDELFEFKSPESSWCALAVRAGYIILRKKKAVDTYLTIMS